jgi:hypothetical protein
MYLDVHEFWKAILQEVVDPETETVLISSYGLYAGISDTGENTALRYNFNRPHQMILDQSNAGKRIIMLISESDPMECVQGCQHCKEKTEKRDDRLQAHVAHWPNISWHLTRDHHLKAILIKKSDGRVVGFSGGRNFTTSEWTDVSFRLSEEDAKELLIYLVGKIQTKAGKLN